MADPIASATPAAAGYINHVPEEGDYSSYKTLAKTAWSKDGSDEHGLTFADFLDVINPLQHLPIISTLYRAITGDKIGLAAKLAGDALYGGPAGLLSSGVTAALESTAGESTGDMVADLANAVFGPSSSGDGKTPTEEARLRDSEQTHEAELTAMAQMAAAQAAPIAAPPVLAAVQPAPSAAASAPKVAPVAMTDDAAAQRIAKAIAEARRAQAGTLLASLQEAPPTPGAKPAEVKPGETTSPAADAKSANATGAKPAPPASPATAAMPPANPYLPPDRPLNNWSNETLAETIARYERAVAANRR